ncbi:unnamed protein product [Clavelina lepadiformis]|uniref:Uncharacterized protein n=1 Tax=Clavelina lepadiformis TaxID=159417 RepID=A0ABP0FYG5_CLALP
MITKSIIEINILSSVYSSDDEPAPEPTSRSSQNPEASDERDEISFDDLIEMERKIGKCERWHSELGFMDEENYLQNENTHKCKSLRDLKKHMRRSHQPREVPRPQIPRSEIVVVDGDTIPEDIPEDYKDIYQRNWQALRTHFHIGNRVQEHYTIHIPDQSMIDQVLEPLWPYFRENIFQRQRRAFKIQVSFGFILRYEGSEKDESPVLYRYFYLDSHSNYLYLGPQTIRDRTEFDSLSIFNGRISDNGRID